MKRPLLSLEKVRRIRKFNQCDTCSGKGEFEFIDGELDTEEVRECPTCEGTGIEDERIADLCDAYIALRAKFKSLKSLTNRTK